MLAVENRNPSHSTTYHINGIDIRTESLHRDLGVMIASDQSWSGHIDCIVTRAYKILGILRHTFGSVNGINEKKILYLSLVRSQLVYCSAIWRPNLLKDIKKLEQVQRRATKFILGDYNSNYKQRLVTLKMLPLMYELEVNDILYCVKSLKTPQRKLIVYLTDHFMNI